MDHDDTAVDSTAHIHHPIYVELMAELRPDIVPVDVGGFIDLNQKKSIRSHYKEDLGFSEEEWQYAFDFWKNHPLRHHVPQFYDGFIDVLKQHASLGGIVAVVSHSNEEAISMHYERTGLVPDKIFGAQADGSKNKPHPYPLEKIMEYYDLLPAEIAVVDDLMPGIEMARTVGAYAIGAGWAHTNDDAFKAQCDHYFDTVKQLEDHLFDENDKRLL
ncbi:MAG: HAD family hydrolase [Nanoarchaeota archaeon]